MALGLKKKDYWAQVGGVEGYIAAIEQLGSGYRELDSKNNGYTKSNSIWGQLAQHTQMSKKDTYESRKWLYTTWHENRRKIRTTFLSSQVDDRSQNLDLSSDNADIDNKQDGEMVSMYFLISFLFVIVIAPCCST